ncbi:MAG: hypothetical protein KKB70_09275 [Proteobacteria bacterium]|nr:hypothetical protein [Pseudomonadota bacterium]MBU1612129.1 hypothetical protein [Pseudomonadota bacterium]
MKRPITHIVFLAAALLYLTTVSAQASEEVRVYQPKMVAAEEGATPQELSPTQLRQQALMLGFVEATLQSARSLIPGTLSEERTQALKSYLEPRAGEWILGYKELASTPDEKGLTMVLEVDVNKRALRETLSVLGLDRVSESPRYVTLLAGSTLLKADHENLAAVMLLTNTQVLAGAGPEFRLERMESGSLRGQLTSDQGAWSAIDANVSAVWFALWGKYNVSGPTIASTSAKTLVVSGWFTPDGANDFDRELRGWDHLVRSAQLVELDMLTAGVTAHWQVDIVDADKFRQRLQSYLPSRGLHFSLDGGS